jgi:hypothetical protein
MAWECSDCGRKEQGESKITVCHHCGRPVCKLHQQKVVDDDAFSAWPDHTVTRVAVHCLDCWQAFHPAVDSEPGAPGPQGLTTA